MALTSHRTLNLTFKTVSLRNASELEFSVKMIWYYKFLIVCQERVGGIVVSIAAFQAVDPGSIPGQRMCLFFFFLFHNLFTLDSFPSGFGFLFVFSFCKTK